MCVCIYRRRVGGMRGGWKNPGKRRAHVLGGGTLVHAVDRQSMANERDDAVLMTWSPQGSE